MTRSLSRSKFVAPPLDVREVCDLPAGATLLSLGLCPSIGRGGAPEVVRSPGRSQTFRTAGGTAAEIQNLGLLSLLILFILVAGTFTAQAQTAANTASSADCACEIALPADTLATVNGVRITRQEIDAPLKAQLEELQQSVVTARARELDLQINSRLLDAAANKRGISAAKLIDEIVLAAVKAPTEAEIQAFYEQNKSRIEGTFAEARAEISDYLLQQRQREEAGRFAQQLRAAAQIKILVEKATPPANAAERARVLATVNGASITAGEVEDSLQPLIYQVQEQLYQLRLRELNLRINDTLLNQEAQRRKLTTQALLDEEVTAKTQRVTEAEAQTFYEQNKNRISGAFETVKPQLIKYLQQQVETRAENAFAAQLRRAALVESALAAPALPLDALTAGDQPAKGRPGAPVTLVEFTDYECPSCAQTQPVLERLLREYDGKLRLVVRDFPLQQHAQATLAAQAAEAARAQGKFWEYHALLFRQQPNLSRAQLSEYAGQLGLDRQQFEAALAAQQFAAPVQRDVQDGVRFGIRATPTLFINGRRVPENTYEALKAAIESALQETARTM